VLAGDEIELVAGLACIDARSGAWIRPALPSATTTRPTYYISASRCSADLFSKQ
jgi:hypothetical protein